MSKLMGHDANYRTFQSALASGKLHHGWILSGPRGLGKASFAREAARLLVDPEGLYVTLIDHGTHPDIITITRPPKEPPKEGEGVDPAAELKRSIGVDQIRELQGRLTTRPGISEKRAIILDSADDMERGAANALLKSLEEPPVGTYFLLVSHASDRLLPTIRSRCQMLRFEPLKASDMEAALRFAVPDISDEDLRIMATAGAGAPGQALEFADLDIADLESSILKIIRTGDRDNSARVALASKLALKAAQPRYEAFLRRVPQIIADHARNSDVKTAPIAIDAWHEASTLASRATSLSLDKQSIVFQMGSLLASLQTHKQS